MPLARCFYFWWGACFNTVGPAVWILSWRTGGLVHPLAQVAGTQHVRSARGNVTDRDSAFLQHCSLCARLETATFWVPNVTSSCSSAMFRNNCVQLAASRPEISLALTMRVKLTAIDETGPVR